MGTFFEFMEAMGQGIYGNKLAQMILYKLAKHGSRKMEVGPKEYAFALGGAYTSEAIQAAGISADEFREAVQSKILINTGNGYELNDAFYQPEMQRAQQYLRQQQPTPTQP